MSIVSGYQMEPMVGDPDDHRPETAWAVIVDPGGSEGRVDTLATIAEDLAPGDRIPLHVHSIDEMILHHSGRGTVIIGAELHTVEAGAVVFIPSGVPHGTVNDGDQAISLQCVYPSTRVPIEYLERNPAPGTEGDRPQPPVTYDLRTGHLAPQG